MSRTISLCGLAAAGFLLTGAMQAQPPQRPIPAIAAPTPTAPFSATRGRLTFDRACASLNFETLPADSGCAARVARGETGPTIEVIVGTLHNAHNAANIQTSVAMLDRAIAAEDHPAAQYLAGSLLTTGEVVAPDYARGIPYLEKAAAGGNVAAADLLATLVLEGRGTAKDAGRAIGLLERAAAGGMEGSAARLALIYLRGVDVPKDPARARGILEAAVAAGVRGAPGILAMLDAEDRIHNIQLHPSEDPAKIEIREYKSFDNPDLPPSFGFTDDFQRVHHSAYSDPAVRDRLERDYPALPTPYLYELARRMAAVSPQKARGYFVLAKMRMVYDARRCRDPQAMEAIPAWDMLVQPDIRHVLIGMTQSERDAAVAFALEREAMLPGDTRPWWVCYSGLANISAAAGGKPLPLPLVAAADWPRLRREAREALNPPPAAARPQ